MDEQMWLACEDWQPMLAHLSGRLSQRKAGLYLCAGLRSLWGLLYDDGSRRAVEAVERGADGVISWEEVQGHGWSAEVPTFGYYFDPQFVRRMYADFLDYPESVQRLLAMGVYTKKDVQRNRPLGRERVRRRLVNAAHIAYHALYRVEEGRLDDHLLEHLAWQDNWPRGWLAREVFGNPFRPAAINPSWLPWNNGLVTRLAQAAYDERQMPSGILDPTRLAILADALEEAGCDDPAILAHLRSVGPHYRGCFVLDALLKE